MMAAGGGRLAIARQILNALIASRPRKVAWCGAEGCLAHAARVVADEHRQSGLLDGTSSP